MFKIRGDKFKKAYLDFVNIWSEYFRKNVFLFIREKYSKSEILKNDSNFESKIIESLIFVFLLGQEKINELVKVQTMFGVSFDINNKEALFYAKKRAGELIKEVDENTRKNIGDIIKDGIENNLSVGEISKRIFMKFNKYSKFRSSLIATMELSNAYEVGKRVQFQKYTNYFGVIGYKRNIHEGDSSVRETHIENSRDGWIEADKSFSGTNTMHAPHDFNCRCSTDYRFYKI